MNIKKILYGAVLALSLAGPAYAASTIWGSTHATIATTNRIPVDISSGGAPNYISVSDLLGYVAANNIALGTPSSVTLTNGTGLPISTGLTGFGTGVATFLGTPSSANFFSAVTGETGSGAVVGGTSPTISGLTLTSSLEANIPNSGSLPATCSVGDLYQNTAAGTGAQLYSCESTNTWAAEAGGGGGGSGTVTTVSVATANGFSGTVANATTTPAITIIAGAITPTSVSASGTLTGTSTSASALAVGANGATNPVLQVDGSIASVATGVKIQGQASGGGAFISAISSGSNDALTLASKGSGDMAINAPSGSVKIQSASSTKYAMNGTSHIFTRSAQSSGAVSAFSYTGAADTSLTASTEALNAYFNLGQIRQHATGALTLQRDFRITGSTHSFIGASTLTDAATLAVDGADSGGTNATITNSHALYIPTIALSNVTNGDAINVAAPTGGTSTNYAIKTTGPSLINGEISGGTKFTTSGCSVSSTTGGATAGVFTLGAASCTVVITMNGATGMTAPNGWTCQAHDQTSIATIIDGETSSTTTTASLVIPVTAGATDVISFSCTGY